MTKEERVKCQLECAQDVCDWCGGRSLYSHKREVSGPNAARNYVHEPARDDFDRVLCKASSIHSRIRFESAEAAKPPIDRVRELEAVLEPAMSDDEAKQGDRCT